jgi:nitronate monooxygenase
VVTYLCGLALVLHDFVNARHGKKQLPQANGLIAVCNGAGGHSGTTNPFALAAEMRLFFAQPVISTGSSSHGKDVATAEMMGAEMAYMGTRFLATSKANIADDYQDMIINSSASDILYTPIMSGINTSFIHQSAVDASVDPADPPPKPKLYFADKLDVGNKIQSNEKKAWRDIWSAGQGEGSIDNSTQ